LVRYGSRFKKSDEKRSKPSHGTVNILNGSVHGLAVLNVKRYGTVEWYTKNTTLRYGTLRKIRKPYCSKV